VASPDEKMTQLFHKNHQKPMFIRAEMEQLGTESWGVVWLPFFGGLVMDS